ncbi:type II toxin-antitoxin system Phd/YefM family antitoxin [Xanthobacter autotrophicus]|uniref:type II toxin-antitoxin system Phd/YefM family antitoxin n=1 Tax=Xanthobacter autotrophicus TaxID=280 RepID=UPI0037279D56
MPITTLSSREVNQDLGRAKRASHEGPVIITDRGKPAHVLLSYGDYLRLTGQHRQANLIDELGLPSGVEDVEVEFPRSRELARPADFT